MEVHCVEGRCNDMREGCVGGKGGRVGDMNCPLTFPNDCCLIQCNYTCNYNQSCLYNMYM